MDAAGYNGVRLTAGAVVLYLILLARDRPIRSSSAVAGSWPGAGALFGYAIAFSAAYLMLGAGTGALILFASVQAGMLAWAFLKGDRPGGRELFGMGIAFAGLIYSCRRVWRRRIRSEPC